MHQLLNNKSRAGLTLRVPAPAECGMAWRCVSLLHQLVWLKYPRASKPLPAVQLYLEYQYASRYVWCPPALATERLEGSHEQWNWIYQYSTGVVTHTIRV